MIQSRRIASWLLVLCDPLGVRRELPRRRLKSADLPGVCDLADRHGVLASVVDNLNQVRQRFGPSGILQGRDNQALEAFLAQAARLIFERTAVAMSLRQQGQELLASLADRGLPSVLIKGSTFAERLYRKPGQRPFVDIDLLVPKAAWDDVGQVLRELGYQSEVAAMKYAAGYGEQSWRHPKRTGLLEVHHDLVNSPTLRKAVAVGFDDLQFEPSPAGPVSAELGPGKPGFHAPRLSPSSMLLIAAVHAATGHGFDKLQHLCDICQAVRGVAGPLDESWLVEAGRRTGSVFSITTALELAGRTLHEPACDQLLARLRFPRPSLLCRSVLTAGTVIGSQGSARHWNSWRRQIYRHLLKHAA